MSFGFKLCRHSSAEGTPLATTIVRMSALEPIPNYVCIEVIIGFVGRDVLGEHRAVARNWTLPPQRITFVQGSGWFPSPYAARSIDRIREEAIYRNAGRPPQEFSNRCEICRMGPIHDARWSVQRVGFITLRTFTRIDQIPYSTRAVQYLNERRVTRLTEVCWPCHNIYWTAYMGLSWDPGPHDR